MTAIRLRAHQTRYFQRRFASAMSCRRVPRRFSVRSARRGISGAAPTPGEVRCCKLSEMCLTGAGNIVTFFSEPREVMALASRLDPTRLVAFARKLSTKGKRDASVLFSQGHKA